MPTPLTDFTVISLAANVPGPVAAARLRDLGARVIKVEPPFGDPLSVAGPSWYGDLHAGIGVRTLNLKDPAERGELDRLLAGADLLLTANRPSALARLGLGWEAIHARFPRLCYVAIVGYPDDKADVAGHDLTYQASAGLLTPPHNPRTLLADLAGAEQAVQAALSLLLERERTNRAGYVQVALSAAVERFTLPWRYGITRPGAVLGGGLPAYRLYATADGWIAVAALEPHFLARLLAELGLDDPDPDLLAAHFAQHSALHWQTWAEERDLPITTVK